MVVALFALLPDTFEPCKGTDNHSTATPLDCRGEVAALTELMPTLPEPEPEP